MTTNGCRRILATLISNLGKQFSDWEEFEYEKIEKIM